MQVTKNPDGSHSPQYNEDWPEDTQVEWYAGCVAADTGLRIDVTLSSSIRTGVEPETAGRAEQYHLTIHGPRTLVSHGPMSPDAAWSWLDGVRAASSALGPKPDAVSR